jgi:hypothetical protein
MKQIAAFFFVLYLMLPGKLRSWAEGLMKGGRR